MDLLPLESVLPKKVYLNNIVIGRQRDAFFVVDGKEHDFSFRISVGEYKPEVFFKIKLSDHIFWLSLEKLPPLSYFSKKFEGVELGSLPEEMRSIVLEACFKNVIDVVEEEIGVVVAIEDYVFGHPGNSFEDELPFIVKVEGVEVPVKGVLHMEGSSLEFLAALLERSSYVTKNRFRFIEVPLYVKIGEETLSLGEFKNLNLRDIILLSDEKFINEGSCKVVIGDHLIYDGVLKNGTLTVLNLMDERVENEGLPHEEAYEVEDEEEEEDVDLEEKGFEGKPSGEPERAKASEEEEHDEEEEVSHELADLPIHVVFEVGQRRLALKDLQSLKEGYTFELDKSIERPVTIRANGRVVGEGELLKVGDRIGVRVISFLKK